MYHIPEFMNQCAQSFKLLDVHSNGKVSRLDYYNAIMSIIHSHDYSCPQLQVIKDIMDVGNNDSGLIMFNEFCVCLFSHSDLNFQGVKLDRPVFSMVTKIGKDVREENPFNDERILEPAAFKKLINK